MKQQLQTVEKNLGYTFKNRQVLQQALTHSSACSGENARLQSYQRLEYLGDRILSAVIAHKLYELYPDAEEGQLSRMQSYLVRKETCSDIAQEMQLLSAIKIGETEKNHLTRKNQNILGDICEAVIGATYIDGGYKAAIKLIEAFWNERLKTTKPNERDAKTRLQEWVQAQSGQTPTYEVVSRAGPDHKPEFKIKVSIEGQEAQIAKGASKRDGEHKAAAKMLAKITGDINND